ncbi:hypothetical protein [Sporosarcina sp. Te-1]|uniref:hypothetical protein n=1 Tax=Sporosarcina sp. Te-1 TaxID=2818390 RepID=UPI001A9F20C5|nr:hypothetical protein [Sporosarcina sp. Te-1]QTD40781.1 hypothetical protein J3U78_18830 [Sporosarcina sp. Te-1]
MFKKAISVVFVSGLVLAGCGNGNNNDAVPDKDETPMENLDNQDLTPRVDDGQTGPNMDGINNGTDNNGNTNGGIINDTNRNGTNGGMLNGGQTNDLMPDMNGDNTTGPDQDKIIDENTSTPSQNNGRTNRNGNNNR